jgi:hypothetical protein
MGNWTYQYDVLNRLLTGSASSGTYNGQNACWSYTRGPHGQVFVRGVDDSFGNRTAQSVQTSACPSSGLPATASYNGNNQVTWTTVNSAVGGFSYDAAGDVLYDGANYYAYDAEGRVDRSSSTGWDAEGRVCAVQSYPTGGPIAYGYIYDAGVPVDRSSSTGWEADGTRVAKGTITPSSSPLTQPPSCDPATNGFTLTESYVIGPSGEELTQLNGSGAWQRTNVYGGGRQLGTYDTLGLHFQITDPLPGSPATGLRRWGGLGTRRMQTNSNGQPETDIQSLPYGDGLATPPDQYAPATADDATPLHFTGKERDSELRERSIQYDTLNRLVTGDGVERTEHGEPLRGGYDAIGNRPAQSLQSSAWSTPGSSATARLGGPASSVMAIRITRKRSRTEAAARSNDPLLQVEEVGSAGEKRMKSLLVVPKLPAITRLKRLRFALPMLFACLLLLAGPAAHGQITNVDDTTSTPIEGAGHDYIKAMNETVNPANGSLSVRIQLPIPKGRGITPSFSIGYDSNGVNFIEPNDPSGASRGEMI